MNRLLSPDLNIVVAFDNVDGKMESVVCPTMAMRNRVRRIVFKGEPPNGLKVSRIPACVVSMKFEDPKWIMRPEWKGPRP